jgi:predicted phosphodiesterase
MDDSFIKSIIENPRKIAKLEFSEIQKILHKARKIFENENLVLNLNIKEQEGFYYVIGDIHGNLNSLLYFIDKINKSKPKKVVFLGDIVDRGANQLECLILVLVMKIISPHQIFLIRGNHETLDMNRAYGFYQEFVNIFYHYDWFNEILSLYDVLPICATLDHSILCVHGGIPTDFSILNRIYKIKTYDSREIYENKGDALFQMMWNDPKEDLKGFSQSFRGKGIYFFGKDVFNDFMKTNNFKFLIRSHECFPEGFRWFFDKRLLSIFSSANYRGYNQASFAIIKNHQILPENIINL